MLIIILAHLPIFTLQRQEGRIFAPMAYTITAALIGSLLFSLTLVPLLCFVLLKQGAARGKRAGARVPARLPRRAARGAAHGGAPVHRLRDAGPRA